MGGIGSGKWPRCQRKTTVEECLSLDVRKLARNHQLIPETDFFYCWWTCGFRLRGISKVTVHEDRIELIHPRIALNDESEIVSCAIPLTWTDCNYGGRRPWFLCPKCGQRVATLHRNGPDFRCRGCHQLVYHIQQESDGSKWIWRAKKVRKRLGGTGNLFDPFPRRPKGMHRRTYRRLALKALRQGLSGN